MTTKPQKNKLALQGTQWAILPEYLNDEILSRAQVDAAAFFDVEFTPTALKKRGSTAVIDIFGIIFKYSNILTMLGMGTSAEDVKAQFEMAYADPEVKNIELTIDSPGGQVGGTNNLASLIYANRNVKPTYAKSLGLVASAAYWIGSAANTLEATDTTDTFGSIGVICTLEKDDKDNYVVLTSSNAPNKNPDPESDEGKKAYQEHIDGLETIFISSVARNRGVSIETVKTDFGKGGVFLAEDALKFKMIDSIGGNSMNLDELKAKHPELVTAVFEEGKAALTAQIDALVAEVATLKTSKTELEAKVALQIDPYTNFPTEVKDRLLAQDKEIRTLKENGMKAELSFCTHEVQTALIGISFAGQTEAVGAISTYIKTLQATIAELGGSKGSDEIPPDASLSKDKQIDALAAKLVAEENMSEYDAYNEAVKRLA